VNSYFLQNTYNTPYFEGYLFGNQLPYAYQSFILNGIPYLFNGQNIYQLSVVQNTGVLSSVTFVCQAMGLTYLATSPTTAYFLSSFDNSIWIFQGGRALTKLKRLTNLPNVVSGQFSTNPDTLVLDCGTGIAYYRDSSQASGEGIWSYQNKKSNQTGTLRYYNTTSGLYIGNNLKSWQYTYYPLAGSTVFPLQFQTAYFGHQVDGKSIQPTWIVTMFSSSSAIANLNITLRAFNEGVTVVENKQITILPANYNAQGFCRFRVTQQLTTTLASSLEIDATSYVMIQNITAEFRNDVGAIYPSMLTV
jgi:hypothetical protein